MSVPAHVEKRLHNRLQHDAGAFARRFRELEPAMSPDERKAAYGWMKVYEHMLNNWGKK